MIERSLDNSDYKEIKALEDSDEPVKPASLLSPEALKWMSKRRNPKKISASIAHILPSRALQLTSIFKGLDIDGSGSIDIAELKDAVDFVASGDTGSDPVLKDPSKLKEFFKTMDIDGNGTVDLKEFLIGMTSQGSGDDGISKQAKLQQAFFDFANKHRRQLIVNRVANEKVSDLVKLDDLKTLFGIMYFKDEASVESIDEQINRVKEQVKKEMKELNSGAQKQYRHKEVVRAREAALFFDAKRKALSKPSIILHSLQTSKIPNAEDITAKLELTIRKEASQSLLHDNKTYIPRTMLSKKSLVKKSNSFVRLEALTDLKNAKNERFQSVAKTLLPPPTLHYKPKRINDI